MTNSSSPVTQNGSGRWVMLHTALQAYRAIASAAYDEVLTTVAQRFAADKSIGKVEIGGLLIWKRLQANTRWAMELMNVSEQQVHEETHCSYTAANDLTLSIPEAASAARSALGALPGFKTGDALASAVLLAAAPQRFAVYDSRAHLGITRLGVELKSGKGRYSRYMQCVEDLRELASAHGHVWTGRDVDLALYWLGRPSLA